MTDEATTPSSVERLRELLDQCVDEARANGWNGEGEYDVTLADALWITKQLRRKPTRAEWREAGMSYVGNLHAAEGAP